jgi:hypothetical protein
MSFDAVRRSMSSSLMACTCAVLASTARAQSFNVDMGSSAHPLPPATFGGGANQPGWWNAMDETLAPAFSATMLDLYGQPTGVTVTLTPLPFDTFAPVVYTSPPGFSSDEDALFGDSLQLSSPGPASFTLTISGLLPDAYNLYGYVGDAMMEGSFAISQCPAQPACVGFPAAFSETYVQRCCSSSSGDFTLQIGTCGSPLSYAAINALQIVRRAFACGNVSEPYCSGQAVGTACACPCGNCGLADRGCENSFATGGARLYTSGTASVGADSLVLRAEFLPPTSSALFFQGTGTLGGGFGTLYGDGLRCVGGTAIRLGTRFATGGVVAFGAGQGSDPLVSVAGSIPPGGGVRFYQVWYRNAPAYCTPATVNLTNGFKVIWGA